MERLGGRDVFVGKSEQKRFSWKVLVERRSEIDWQALLSKAAWFFARPGGGSRKSSASGGRRQHS